MNRNLLVRLFDTVLAHGTSLDAFEAMTELVVDDGEVLELLSECTIATETPVGVFVRFKPQFVEAGITGLI